MVEINGDTAKLFEAMAKVQSTLPTVGKEKEGHGYNYADLAGCIEAAREHLASNGISVLQPLGMRDGKSTIITILAHKDGGSLSTETLIPQANLHGGAKGNPVQEMGAAITYMRRYCLAAVIGLAQEDTDAAYERQQKREDQQREQEKKNYDPASDLAAIEGTKSEKALQDLWKKLPIHARETQVIVDAVVKKTKEFAPKVEMITNPQLGMMHSIFKDYSDEERFRIVSEYFNKETHITSFKDLTKAEATHYIDICKTGDDQENQ